MVKEKKHLQKIDYMTLTYMGQGNTKCFPVPSKSYDLCTCKIWNCYVQQFRRRCIYKKIHYLTLTFGSRLHNVAPVPSTLCDLCIYRVWSYYVKSFRRRSIYKKFNIWPLTLTLGSRSHKNVAQYPLHHVTHPATKFEVATSNHLGGETFTRKFNIWSLTLTLGSRSHKMLPSTLYIMWPF